MTNVVCLMGTLVRFCPATMTVYGIDDWTKIQAMVNGGYIRQAIKPMGNLCYAITDKALDVYWADIVLAEDKNQLCLGV